MKGSESGTHSSSSRRCAGVEGVVDLGDEEEYVKSYLESLCSAVNSNSGLVLERFKDLIRSCKEFEGIVLDLFFKYFVYYEECLGYSGRDYFDRFLLPRVLLYLGHSFTGLVCVGILVGSLPAAYFALRQIFEAVLMTVYADTEPKLRGLSIKEKIEKVARMRIGNIIDRVSGVNESWRGQLREIYATLSSYLHPITGGGRGGVVGIAEGAVEEHGGPPSYAVLGPTSYCMGEPDEAELKELEKNIGRVKDAVELLVDVWSERAV
jgi:hypothetical protein